MNFRKITLEDKPIFDEYFRAKRYDCSECTFTNLFMWRHGYNIEWTMVDNFLCIKAGPPERPFFLPPFGKSLDGFDKVLQQFMDYFKQLGLPFLLKGTPRNMVETLIKFRPECFTFEEDRANYDYVYLAKDLIELKGRKYSTKKNHLNAFKRAYSNFKYLPMTEDLIQDCIQNELEWYENRGDLDDPSLNFERRAIIETLQNFAYLDYQGGVITINDKVEAFTLGEQLNEDTAVIHIEKGNAGIRGLYQVINQQFCEHAWSEMTYINREEDMGIEGLRIAKESYRPVKMIEKFNVRLTDEV